MGNSRIYYSQESEAKAMRRFTMFTIMWLALGLAAGAVMALLFAPSAGDKTRKQLSKNLEEGWKESQDAFEPLVHRLEKEMSELRQSVEDGISKLK